MALDAEQVLKPARKLRKLLKKITKKPALEQVHDLRTHTRSLEATLAAFSLQSKDKKLLKGLARIHKKAGRVRDMDVLTGFAAALNPKGEENCQVRLIEHLASKRKAYARKLHAAAAKNRGRLRTRLKRTSAELEKLLGVKGKSKFASKSKIHSMDAPTQAAASALRLEAALRNPAHLGKSSLHPYRLKIKELRNLLRAGEASGSSQFVEALGLVKNSIGEWHDWEELLATAQNVLDHTNCRLVRQITTTAEAKYGQALAHTENMRRKFLSVQPGKRAHRRTHAPETAWEAASSLAA